MKMTPFDINRDLDNSYDLDYLGNRLAYKMQYKRSKLFCYFHQEHMPSDLYMSSLSEEELELIDMFEDFDD